MFLYYKFLIYILSCTGYSYPRLIFLKWCNSDNGETTNRKRQQRPLSASTARNQFNMTVRETSERPKKQKTPMKSSSEDILPQMMALLIEDKIDMEKRMQHEERAAKKRKQREERDRLLAEENVEAGRSAQRERERAEKRQQMFLTDLYDKQTQNADNLWLSSQTA